LDLTTAHKGEARLLRRHFQELCRRIRRVYGIELENFLVQTKEGYGVLHCLLAINSKRLAYIPHRWLSDQWQDIHGASVVMIRRARQGRSDRIAIARYFADQGERGEKLVRFTYSWRKTRVSLGAGWTSMKRSYRRLRRDYALNFGDLIKAWDSILTTGRAVLANFVFTVKNRAVFASGVSP
jgi:hypothetical protein